MYTHQYVGQTGVWDVHICFQHLVPKLGANSLIWHTIFPNAQSEAMFFFCAKISLPPIFYTYASFGLCFPTAHLPVALTASLWTIAKHTIKNVCQQNRTSKDTGSWTGSLTWIRNASLGTTHAQMDINTHTHTYKGHVHKVRISM